MCAQLWQRHGQRRAIDERHRGCEHAGREHHLPASRRNLTPQLPRTRLSRDDAAAARLDKRLRHDRTITPR
jgi:hypothetical protein